MPAAPAASTATATSRVAVMASDAGAPVGVSRLLGADDLVDPAGRTGDLAGLVPDDVVVVLLPGELERRVALADVELVGRLGGAGLQPGEEVLERRRHKEDEQR